MQGPARNATLLDLRERIANIENRPGFSTGLGLRQASGEGFLQAPRGLLHEVFADEMTASGAVLGFALGQARSFLDERRPALLHLQLQREGQEMGVPYAAGFPAFGIPPENVVLIRPENPAELLWAAEEALACRAVGAVIVDIAGDPKALDFTASRRLSLRAQAAETSILLLRYARWREASAAQLRWQLSPAASGTEVFDPRAPGEFRWRVRLEKGFAEGRRDGEWVVSWTENGFAAVDIGKRGGTARTAAFPRPLPAALGDRLPKTA